MTAPLSVLLVAEPGSPPSLQAQLRNHSAAVQWILHDPLLQPSLLLLAPAKGAPVQPFDERTRQKFDRTVRAEMFQPLDPGKTLELDKARFESWAPGRYHLRWGPFHYRDIPAGSWTVRCVFESKAAMPGAARPVWNGRIVSDAVTIQLE